MTQNLLGCTGLPILVNFRMQPKFILIWLFCFTIIVAGVRLSTNPKIFIDFFNFIGDIKLEFVNLLDFNEEYKNYYKVGVVNGLIIYILLLTGMAVIFVLCSVGTLVCSKDKSDELKIVKIIQVLSPIFDLNTRYQVNLSSIVKTSIATFIMAFLIYRILLDIRTLPIETVEVIMVSYIWFWIGIRWLVLFMYGLKKRLIVVRRGFTEDEGFRSIMVFLFLVYGSYVFNGLYRAW